VKAVVSNAASIITGLWFAVHITKFTAVKGVNDMIKQKSSICPAAYKKDWLSISLTLTATHAAHALAR